MAEAAVAVAYKSHYRAMVNDAKPKQRVRGLKTGLQFLPPPLPVAFKEANCATTPAQDRDKWWPQGDPKDYTVQADNRRDGLWVRFCNGCPVLTECYAWSMAYEPFGIWAGTTPHERYAARKDEELVAYGRFRAEAGRKPLEGIGNGA